MQQPPLDHNERPRTYAADIVHPATDSELADVAAQEFERINAEVLADTLYGSDKSKSGPADQRIPSSSSFRRETASLNAARPVGSSTQSFSSMI